jgi:hypothetical protein
MREPNAWLAWIPRIRCELRSQFQNLALDLPKASTFIRREGYPGFDHPAMGRLEEMVRLWIQIFAALCSGVDQLEEILALLGFNLKGAERRSSPLREASRSSELVETD